MTVDIEATKLANQLVSKIKDGNVADEVFRTLGDITRHPDYFEIPAGLTAAAVSNGKKLKATEAQVLAKNLIDESALHALASTEKRLTVLREIASNTRINFDTAEVLRLKGIKLNDADTLRRLVNNTSPELDAYFSMLIRGNLNAIETAFKTKENTPGITESAVLRAFQNATTVTGEELDTLEQYRDAARTILVRYIEGLIDPTCHELVVNKLVIDNPAVFNQRGHTYEMFELLNKKSYDKEMMQRLIDAENALTDSNISIIAAGSLNQHRRYYGRSYGSSQPYTMTSEALQTAIDYVEQHSGTRKAASMMQLLSGTRGFSRDDQNKLFTTLVDQLKLNNLDTDFLVRFVGNHSSDLYDLDATVETLTQLAEQGLLPKEEFARTIRAVDRALQTASHMSDTTFRVAIRNSENFITSWFGMTVIGRPSDRCALPMTKERIAILRDDLNISSDSTRNVESGQMRVMIQKWIDRVYGARNFETIEGNVRETLEFAPHLLDCVGPITFHEYDSQDALAELIAEQATSYFGSNAEMWKTFIAMADVLGEEPISEMMNGIRILLGGDPLPDLFSDEEPNDTVVEAPVERTTTGAVVQMNLFT